jgi:7-cyano-7-deazaguanine synthase
MKNRPPIKAVVVLSGGQDSTTCLAWAAANPEFDEVHAVTFDYGQRHKREIDAAEAVFNIVAKHYTERLLQPERLQTHQFVILGSVLQGTSPLVSSAALEQYRDHQSLPGGLEKTFVPGRNLLFLTLAANVAYALGATHVITGVCQEDFGGYPDCRQVFIDRAQEAIREGFSYLDPDTGGRDDFYNFRIHTPLMNLTKAESVLLAAQLPGCMDALAYSHTAYDGQYPPTGKDHASLLRAKGFEEAGIADPLVLRAYNEGLMDLPDTANYANLRRT